MQRILGPMSGPSERPESNKSMTLMRKYSSFRQVKNLIRRRMNQMITSRLRRIHQPLQVIHLMMENPWTQMGTLLPCIYLAQWKGVLVSIMFILFISSLSLMRHVAAMEDGGGSAAPPYKLASVNSASLSGWHPVYYLFTLLIYVSCTQDIAGPSKHPQVQGQRKESVHQPSEVKGKRPVKVSEKAK
jgi:hypothetical protein